MSMNVVRVWYVSLNDKKWLKRNARTPNSYNRPPFMDTGTGRGVATLKETNWSIITLKQKKSEIYNIFWIYVGGGEVLKNLTPKL